MTNLAFTALIKSKGYNKQRLANGKPFVNSFGEATKREITATSYKNSQARLDKEIMRFVGGEINRKKQTKRRK